MSTVTVYLQTAEKQIKKGTVRLDVIKSNLTRHFKLLDEQEFNARLKEEYDELYPATREMTEEEQNADYISDCMYRDDLDWEHIPIDEYVFNMITIDYSEDESYVTYEEYGNETRVLTPAIEEVVEVDGEGSEVIIQEYVPEVTELVRPYTASDVTGKVEEYLTNSELYKERIKLGKLETINNLVVSRYGVPLDAHDVARSNMNGVVALANFAFIQAMVQANPELQPIYDAVYKTTKTWKGADNLPHEVQIETVAELGLQAMEEYANVLLK